MGQPSINITFQTVGTTAVQRSQKGIVALILKDTKANGGGEIFSATAIPKDLSAANKEIFSMAFIGNNYPPKSIKYYILKAAETIEDALEYFSREKFDYLVVHPDAAPEDITKVATWIKSERENDHEVKAVLPDTKGNHEGIVNFTTKEIKVGDKEVSTAAFCARIAGLLAGTPVRNSATYAVLPEVTGIKKLNKSEMDNAANSGEFIILHDGQKFKTGRAVNSLTTTAEGKGEAFQKIKIVEVMDMAKFDIRTTAADNYIGKYANSYDNKCVLITAIQGYFEALETDGLVARGSTFVDIDMEEQENYIKSQGIDTSTMNEQAIREYMTGSTVFLAVTCKILDAIEDMKIRVTM